MEECVCDEKYDNNNRTNDEIEVTCLGVTPPDSTDRGAAEEKYDNDERNDAEKEAEYPVLTPPVDMEEGVGKKMITMIEYMRKQVKVKKKILHHSLWCSQNLFFRLHVFPQLIYHSYHYF